MSRLAIALLTSLALSLTACAEKPGTKKDDKKDAKKPGKDGKDAKDGKADGDAEAKVEEKSGDAKERTPPAE